MKKLTSLILMLQVLLQPLVSSAEPRAYLRSDSGYLQPEKFYLDSKPREVSNLLMNTYDISDFEDLKLSNPSAYSSMKNHDQYGVVGTRGFIGGALAAVAVAFTSFGRNHAVVPVGLFVAGFIYGMNSRHMARHNLHKAINQINGVETLD